MTLTDTERSTDAPRTDDVVVPVGGDTVDSHLHPTPSYDLEDHPVPNGLEEVWRFTPLRRLRGLLEAGPSDRSLTVATELDDHNGVTFTEIDREAARGIADLPPTDRSSALAVAYAPTVRLLDVPAEYAGEKPIVLTLAGDGAGEPVFGHTVIRIGAHANATVVLDHRGSAVYAGATSVVIGDGASLTLATLQGWDDDAVHVGRDAIRLGRDSSLRYGAVSTGGDLVRLSSQVDYAGPGGEAELLGIYFADAGQHLEHRLFVDHNAPRTKSNVDYKGALQGKDAHTVWIGDVLIRKVAEGIETYEQNRNLVLTDGCRADSVPNLEIETGEIEGAGHASTTGRFDDEQLFYLQSRGIDEIEARRLVVHGFFADIVRRLRVHDLDERLLAVIERELETA